MRFMSQVFSSPMICRSVILMGAGSWFPTSFLNAHHCGFALQMPAIGLAAFDAVEQSVRQMVTIVGSVFIVVQLASKQFKGLRA